MGRKPGHTRIPTLICTGTSVVLVTLLGASACDRGSVSSKEDKPVPVKTTAQTKPSPPAEPEYVGSKRCASCHADQVDLWQTSDHAHSMAKANPKTVRGNFNGTRFASSEMPAEAHFRVQGDTLSVSLKEREGPSELFPVAYTLAHAPLQQVLIPQPGGRLQVFPVAWDTKRGRWFDPLASGDPHGEGTPLHWKGVYANWNAMCSACHSTGLSKGYDLSTNQYKTRWAEIHVGCEACHGPGSRHVSWASEPGMKKVENRGLAPIKDGAEGEQRELALCGPCHSRRQGITAKAVVGEPYLDHYAPELLREGLYFADGQILDEVFVLGSFLQSRMHREGVKCSTCHDVHSGHMVVPEAELCVRCHEPETFATAKHHLHPEGSEGARCVSCHMPERTYMGVDPRRDHSIRPPRPDLTVSLGVPNACNGCHDDKTPAWAAAAIAKVHGPPDPHYGELLTKGREGRVEALSGLVGLVGDVKTAAIVRATAVELLLTRYPPRSTQAVLGKALRSPEPLVRLAAVDGTLAWPPRERAEALIPLLKDPRRAVRLQAARTMVGLEKGLKPELRGDFDRALSEYVEAQVANADHPGGRLNLATLYTAQGDAASAEREYRAALTLDPSYVPAAVNLAGLLEGRGDRVKAVALLLELAKSVSGSGELHYALGLLLAAEKRYLESAEHLRHAVALRPGDLRVKRNFAKVLERLDPKSRARFESLKPKR